MNIPPLMLTTYRRCWDQVVIFLRFMDNPTRSALIASATLGLWTRAAMDQPGLGSCPWSRLFAITEVVTLKTLGMGLTLTSGEFWDAIPLDIPGLPYDLAHVEAELWKLAQLMEWDRHTINALTKQMQYVGFAPAGDLLMLGRNMDGSPEHLLARRAFEVYHAHEQDGCVVCQMAGHRWDAEDRATEQWLTEQRLAREGI